MTAHGGGTRPNRLGHQLPLVLAALLLTAACTTGSPETAPTPSTAPDREGTSPSTDSPGRAHTPTPGRATPTEPAEGLPSDLAGALRQATWDDDYEEARRLIRAGADVNAKDATEQSAYLIATSEGRWRILKVVLRNGARVNDLDSYRGTGLIRAAERGHALVVGQLLRAGIKRDHVNRLGWQAIHEAVWLGEETDAYLDTVRVLAAGGVELARPSVKQGLTPRQMATERGYSQLGRALDRILAADIAPGTADQTLLGAAISGDADLAAAALRAGADLEARDERQRTPLLLAVSEDNVAVVRLLVASGADPNALDDQHDTPWLVTGVTGSVAALEALLPANPDLTIENRFGGLSVIPASERGHVDYVRRVVHTSIDLDHVNRLGWTALLEAVILGDGSTRYQTIVRVLLRAGADRNIKDRDGVSALEHAERRGYDDIARMLRPGRDG